MQTKITTNTDKIAKLFDNLKNDIVNDIIPKGLDQSLADSLQELKSSLLFLVNNEIRYKRESSDPKNELTVNIAQSDKTILNYLGYNLDNVKKNSYSLDSYNAKIKFIQDYTRPNENQNLHCRVEVPCDPDESILEIYNKALKNFQESLYVDNSTGITRYLVLTDKGKDALRDRIKIFCSTYTGISSGSALFKAIKRRELVSGLWLVLDISTLIHFHEHIHVSVQELD